jgi:hypothetical protein
MQEAEAAQDSTTQALAGQVVVALARRIMAQLQMPEQQIQAVEAALVTHRPKPQAQADRE